MFHLPPRLPRMDPFVLRLLRAVSLGPTLPPVLHVTIFAFTLASEDLLGSSVLKSLVCWIVSSRQNIFTTYHQLMRSFLAHVAISTSSVRVVFFPQSQQKHYTSGFFDITTTHCFHVCHQRHGQPDVRQDSYIYKQTEHVWECFWSLEPAPFCS